MPTGYKINYLQTDQNGTLLQERSYDAWGRLRHPDDWSAEYYEPENLLNYTYRSYTGHSLSRTCFGNPMTATFHSPDPYVQMPTNTLNYNRYSYVLNNPLKYTDPSGEIFGSFITFTAGWFYSVGSTLVNYGMAILRDGALDPTNAKENRNEAWSNANQKVNHTWKEYGKKSINALKIDIGLAFHVPYWETPQAVVGNIASHIRNLSGNVDDVWYYKGSIVVNNDNLSTPRYQWGFTFGQYINSQNLKKGIEDRITRHEYGHTIQSRILGPSYLWKIALPSGNSFKTGSRKFHHHQWYEVWANKLAGVPSHSNYPRNSINTAWYMWLYYFSCPIPLTF